MLFEPDWDGRRMRTGSESETEAADLAFHFRARPSSRLLRLHLLLCVAFSFSLFLLVALIALVDYSVASHDIGRHRIRSAEETSAPLKRGSFQNADIWHFWRINHRRIREGERHAAFRSLLRRSPLRHISQTRTSRVARRAFVDVSRECLTPTARCARDTERSRAKHTALATRHPSPIGCDTFPGRSPGHVVSDVRLAACVGRAA